MPQFMVWQNGNCTDTALDIGELITAMIKEKKIYCISPSSLTCALHQLLSSAFQIKCEELKPSFVT